MASARARSNSTRTSCLLRLSCAVPATISLLCQAAVGTWEFHCCIIFMFQPSIVQPYNTGDLSLARSCQYILLAVTQQNLEQLQKDPGNVVE